MPQISQEESGAGKAVINIRSEAAQRNLIDRAAKKTGRSRSDFMLDAACREAENVLLDQVYFTVNEQNFLQFQELLLHPLPVNEKLRSLLKQKPVWEKSGE